MGALKLLVVIACAAILLPRIYFLVKIMDSGESVFNHKPGPCYIVDGVNINGAEDMELIPGTNVALLSTGLKWDDNWTRKRIPNILYFDFSKQNQGAKPADIKGLLDLQESNFHGLSIFKGENSKVTLFIVNHLKKYTVVDKFNVDLINGIPYLTFIERVQDKEHFHVINDVKAPVNCLSMQQIICITDLIHI
jgi:hypothetical protein